MTIWSVENYHSELRLRGIMRRIGIWHELKRQGSELGNKIKFGDHGSMGFQGDYL